MQIVVSGKQIDIGKALQQYVEEALIEKVQKYFDRAVDARVVFSKESHLFRTDIKVNDGTGKALTVGEARENEVYSSFDRALERIEKQLRRYHRRLKNHHKEMIEKVERHALQATHYVVPSDSEEVSEEDHPLVIAEQPETLETLVVSDAVMRLELTNLPVLLFINRASGNLNVVYRREDGNISWVDPKTPASKTSS